MWQKPSLTKSMMNELSNYNNSINNSPNNNNSNVPSSPKSPFSPSSHSFANRALPNKPTIPQSPNGSSSNTTGNISIINQIHNINLNGGSKPFISGGGGSSSLPSSPVSSPMNPFSPNGGGSGRSSRRRGVTVAGGSEQVETRRRILLGNSRPFRRRANSMEVLNSWDYIPFQKKPLDEEQGQVDQYIQGDKENEDVISYESYITNRSSLTPINETNKSDSFIGLDQSNNSSAFSSSSSSSSSSIAQPSIIANSVPPLSIPSSTSSSSSSSSPFLSNSSSIPSSSSTTTTTTTATTTTTSKLKAPLPSPRFSINSNGSQSPPVPPRSSKSLGLTNDFSINLSSSTSSSSLLTPNSVSSSSTPISSSTSTSFSSTSSSLSSSSSISSSQSISKLIYESNEENKFIVVSGPKDLLVEYLCNKNKLDFSFVNSFIFSFRYFIEPEDLFNCLMTKYEAKAQTTSSMKVSKQFEEIQDRIRQNIMIIISVWVDCNYSDFEDNSNLNKRLLKLVQESPNAIFLKDSIDRQRVSKIPILDLYEKLKDELLLSLSPRGSSSSYSLSGSGGISSGYHDVKNIKNSFFSLSTMMEWLMNHLSIGHATADSILKKLFKLKVIASLTGGGFTNISSSQTNSNSKSSKEELYFFVNTTIKSTINKEIYSRSFMDYHPQDIAKQLTLMEFKLFQDIKMKELYHKSWTIGKTKFENSPTVMSLITMSNKIANWVATEVVTTPHPKKRVEVLKRFISVAEHCKKINNFNTLMEVISGLSNSAVSRLKETWKSLPTRYVNSFNSLQNFLKTDENWKFYRQTLKTKETPCLPYLGLFLQDINFIEDGNANYLENDWVNFKKMNILTSVFSEIQYFQKHPYFSFSAHSNIQTYFEKDIVILPEKELYAFSKFVESPTNPLNKLSKFMKSSINI